MRTHEAVDPRATGYGHPFPVSETQQLSKRNRHACLSGIVMPRHLR